MVSQADGQTPIREAVETEASQIAELYHAVYGAGYVHPRFYDEREIKGMIFDEDTLVLVAEDAASGRLVGAASVLFASGAFADMVGEFGRLVVHPDFRGQRLGSRLMEERLARVGERLHVAFVEARVTKPYSARISQSHGFVPVGFLPHKVSFADTNEHGAYLVQYFGDALSLRKNHPRVIPEAQYLAQNALEAVGLSPDVVIDEDAAPYPKPDAFDLEELTAKGYASLLRIERGRVRHREVFGPQRLHSGMFKLAASHSSYLVARDGSRIVGAIGYTLGEPERCARIFEVIQSEETAVPFLFDALASRCAEDDATTLEIDVSAHAPRMQRTLLAMDYLPVAYVPALAFDEVERVDVVKMYRLLGDLETVPFDAPEPIRSVGQYVLDQFAKRQVMPRLIRAMDRLDICRGLTQEQSARLLGEFATGAIEAGGEIFGQGAAPERMMLVLGGRARVLVDDALVGAVEAGESLGEVSFLSGTQHSATAVAETDMEVGVLTRERLDGLVRRRPDIGAIVYRNLAEGLGEKLRRADRSVASEVSQEVE